MGARKARLFARRLATHHGFGDDRIAKRTDALTLRIGALTIAISRFVTDSEIRPWSSSERDVVVTCAR